MLVLLAGFLTVSGLFFTYVAVGIVRNNERRRGEAECDERLEILRRELRKRQR